MKARVNGKVGSYTDQEIKYLKDIYGTWEEENILIFKRMDFLNIKEMASLLKKTKEAIYKRSSRDPKRFPLDKKGDILGAYADNFLKNWI